MKILILTQKVDKNDDLLGFFHGWLKEFSEHFETVSVIGLGVGEYDLPDNVKVFSLGKEENNFQFSIFNFQKLKYLINFYKLIWKLRNDYDSVFVHMNPEYVVLGGVFWRLWGKKIALWYTHKNIDFKLRVAEKITNIIFSASKESFRLKSKKLKVMGHGIDINRFLPNNDYFKKDGFFEIITVGRVSPTKNQLLIIEASKILVNKGVKNFICKIIGVPNTEVDKKYHKELKEYVEKNNLENFVKFIGSISHDKIIPYYQKSDIFINLSDTGSVDKVVLEAMSCGVCVFTSNEAFKTILPNKFLLEKKSEILANKLESFVGLSNAHRETMVKDLRELVVKNNALPNLIKKIKESF